MKEFFTVAKFTAKEMAKRKSFIISSLIIVFLIVIGFNVPNILNRIKDKTSSNSSETILVVDYEKIFGDALNVITNASQENILEISNENLGKNDIQNKIDKGDIKSAIIISKENELVKMEYVVDSLGISGADDTLIQMLTDIYKNIKLANLGFSQEQIIEFNEPIITEIVELGEGTSGVMLFITMMLSIVLFYAIYFCAYQVSSSITTEKTSKIMETLVTSTKPSTIVLGKTAGIGFVGLIQVIVMVITAVVSYKLFLPEGILEGIFDVSKLTPQFVVITLIYFLLGYTLFALLYALTGSTVSKPEDINSANSPVAILAVIGFYLAYFSMMNPTSSINKFASIFPFSSAFSMPFRLIGNNINYTEVAISLAVLVATIIIVARVAIKIYSSAILHYGTKLSLKDILKMYKDKNKEI